MGHPRTDIRQGVDPQKTKPRAPPVLVPHNRAMGQTQLWSRKGDEAPPCMSRGRCRRWWDGMQGAAGAARAAGHLL